MRVSDTTTNQLNWLVAKCEGHNISTEDLRYQQFQYSTDWTQGGPIIGREHIELRYHAVIVAGIWYRDGIGGECTYKAIGPTPLIAAMRCFVISKLGEEVEVPDDLA
jgi:hypothetical protein